METQVKSARAKQKNHAKGQRKASDHDQRKLSSGPFEEIEQSRRLFIPAPNKRTVARFAKGPSDAGGFTYPRRRVSEVACLDVQPLPSVSPLENETVHSMVAVSAKLEPSIEAEIVEQDLKEKFCTAPPKSIPEPELVSEFLECAKPPELSTQPASEPSESLSKSPEPVSTIDEPVNPAETLASKKEVDEFTVEEECVQLKEMSNKVEEHNPPENSSTKIEPEDTSDDTVGPGDSRSSESESSEESDVEPEPAPITPPLKLKPASSKPITPPVVRKAVVPVSPVHRKVLPPTPPARSSWSKFLPLVIEIKATIPYPMHMLGFIAVVVTGLLLRLLYQFGADLGGEMELQGQLIRLAKVAFLFVVVAVCVNFVEDNKELRQKEAVPPAQPKLRPSKVSKNKKKMMLKVS